MRVTEKDFSRSVGMTNQFFLCVLCIAMLKSFLRLRKFYAAKAVSFSVLACLAASSAVMIRRPFSVTK